MATMTSRNRLTGMRRRLDALWRDLGAARRRRREEALEWTHAIESSNERFEHPNELALHGVAADMAAGVSSREKRARAVDEFAAKRSGGRAS